MERGVVKFFNDARGFGFITRDLGARDVFVHHTAIQADGYRNLAEGDVVEFEVVQGAKGLQAANVRRIDASAPTGEEFGDHEVSAS